MGKNVVQISLSDSEYEKAMELAKETGLSLPLFFKSKGLDIRADNHMDELLVLVADFPTGWFSVKQVFGTQRWGQIEDSKKRILGKCFFFEVERGNVPKVRAAGKDAANTQWYYKGIDKIYYEQKVPAKLIEEIEEFMALPVAEIDKRKALEYATALSKALCDGAQDFHAEVDRLTENAQELFDNSGFPDGVIWEINKKLEKIVLAENVYAFKLFEQLMELATNGRRKS